MVMDFYNVCFFRSFAFSFFNLYVNCARFKSLRLSLLMGFGLAGNKSLSFSFNGINFLFVFRFKRFLNFLIVFGRIKAYGFFLHCSFKTFSYVFLFFSCEIKRLHLGIKSSAKKIHGLLSFRHFRLGRFLGKSRNRKSHSSKSK